MGAHTHLWQMEEQAQKGQGPGCCALPVQSAFCPPISNAPNPGHFYLRLLLG